MGMRHAGEPSDCWKLVGIDDALTPPTVARLLNKVGSRAEWRRAGLPVLFDERGDVRSVLRCGREYRFELVGECSGACLPQRPPLAS